MLPNSLELRELVAGTQETDESGQGGGRTPSFPDVSQGDTENATDGTTPSCRRCRPRIRTLRVFQRLPWDKSHRVCSGSPAGKAVPSCLQRAAHLFLMELLLLACQCGWRPRARLSEADVLMKRRPEDCLPRWRQTFLLAKELAPVQDPETKMRGPGPVSGAKHDSEASLMPRWGDWRETQGQGSNGRAETNLSEPSREESSCSVFRGHMLGVALSE